MKAAVFLSTSVLLASVPALAQNAALSQQESPRPHEQPSALYTTLICMQVDPSQGPRLILRLEPQLGETSPSAKPRAFLGVKILDANGGLNGNVGRDGMTAAFGVLLLSYRSANGSFVGVALSHLAVSQQGPKENRTAGVAIIEATGKRVDIRTTCTAERIARPAGQ